MMIDPLAESRPWPNAHDTLAHQPDKYDGMYNSVLHTYGDGWDSYAEGYKEAGDILVKRIADTRIGMDSLVFPVMFLYRHHLELKFKEIIISGNSLLGNPERAKNTHSIIDLWKQCRSLLEKIYPTSSKKPLFYIDNVINEFNEIDHKSESFRYPEERNGQRTLQGVEQINLIQIRDVMANVHSLLEGASIGISAYREECPRNP